MISMIPWEEVVAKLGPHHFMVDDLQAAEPADLTVADGVLVSWDPGELDSMGLPRVEVRAATRDAIVGYVRDNWGDDDGYWFQTWVIDRIIEVGRPAVEAKKAEFGGRRHLVVRYDVTDLTEAEVDYLSGELHAIAEATSDGADGHPDVPLVSLDEIKIVEAS